MIATEIGTAVTILDRLGYEVEVNEGDKTKPLKADDVSLKNSNTQLEKKADNIEIQIGRQSINWNSLSKYLLRPEAPARREQLSKLYSKKENWDFSGSQGISIGKDVAMFIIIIVLLGAGLFAAKYFGFF